MRRLSPRTRHVLRLAVFAAAVIGVLFGLGSLWLHLTDDPLIDVRAYYDAASRLNAGEPLYPPDANTNRFDYYRYPPLLAVVLRPFALLPYAAFAALWEALIVASFVALLWRLGLLRRETWLAVGLLAWPISWAVTIGQAHVLMTLLVSLGTPLGIALAAQLKLFPALIALYWLGRREWPSLGRFVGWSLALVALQVVLEPRGSLDFLGVTSLEQVGRVRNLSPYALSPALWAVLVVVGAVATLALARTRWGWAAAVWFSTLATPRFLAYMFMTLLAALRRPSSEAEVVDDALAMAPPAADRTSVPPSEEREPRAASGHD